MAAGGGFFLDKFDKSKWVKYGVEIDPDTVDFARHNFGISDIRIWDSKNIPFDNQSMDTIVFRGSFEHIPAPHIVAKEVQRVLKDGGYLYMCAIPNVDSFSAHIYREKWNQFDAKEHIFMFSPRTLRKMFEPLGFRYVKHILPYEETPYCNLEADMEKIIKDYQLYKGGKRDQMDISPAFWGNMLNILFKKREDG